MAVQPGENSRAKDFPPGSTRCAMARVRSFPVPPSRMPFVNAEFAQVETPRGTRLVSSVWGGQGKSRLYLLDPLTGDFEERLLPGGEPGAYMLQTGPDRR